MSASQANRDVSKAMPPALAAAQKKKKGGKAADCEKSEDGGDDDEEDDDEGGDEGMDKSRTSVDDLKKALAGMAAHIQENDPVDRKQSLLTKAQAGETLSKSEKTELFALMEGNTPAAPANESLSKSLSENDTLQKGFDVSDFLGELSSQLCKAQDALTDRISKSQTAQNDFNLSLAKAVAHSGRVTLDAMGLIKSIADRVGAIEAQPAHAPRSNGNARAMEKSFATGGQAATGGKQLNKSETLNVLTAMHEASIKDGREGMSKSGQDNLNLAITKYETTNSMSKSLLDEVGEFIRENRQSVNRAQ